MKKITRLNQEFPIKDIYLHDIIVLIMGINNEMSRGFNKVISVNFPNVKKEEAKNGYGDKRKYGKIKPIYEGNLTFCVCYAIKNGKLDKELLKECFFSLNNTWHYSEVVVCSPEYLEDDIFYDGNIYNVYDDPDDDFSLKYYHEFNKLKKDYKDNKLTKDEYLLSKNKLTWEQNNGVLHKMPDGWEPDKKSPFDFLRKK